MAVNEHPWMRRNLIEGFYSLADENVRYLYNNWIGHLAQKEDRDGAVALATASRAAGWRSASPARSKRDRATARRAAARIDRVPLAPRRVHQRGPLHAHRQRHRDDSLLLRGRAGDGARPHAARQFAGRRPARAGVLAAYTLRDNTLTDLPLAVMRRLNDPEPSVRAASNEFYRSLPLKVVEQNRREAVETLKELLASRHSEAQIAALDRVKALGAEFARNEKFDEEVKDFVLRTGDGADKRGGRRIAGARRFPAPGR